MDFSSLEPARPGAKKRSPFRRSDWPTGVARRVPTGLIHEAGDMRMGPGQLRDEAWESIGDRTRERLLGHAGRVIEWWATADGSDPGQRPKAVVFGESGLAIAEPRLNAEGRPAYMVSCYTLDPESFRHVQIDHRPLPNPFASTKTPRNGAGGSGPGTTATKTGAALNPAARSVLGNLPPKAQELIQRPFLTGQDVLRCDWYYEGQEQRLTMFMLFLAGRGDVTVAHGTRWIPAGRDESTAHWSLVCYRAPVMRRMGR